MRDPRIPNLFIVGAGKAGTSALFEWLGRHPDIFISKVKEPNYFGSDLTFSTPRLTTSAYLDLFNAGTLYKYRGEASVSYLLSKTAATEIRDFSPEARILILVRNPFDLLVSRHAQNIICSEENIYDLGQALEAEVARKEGRMLPRGIVMVNAVFYRDWVRLAEQAARFINCFGRHRVFVALFDDLREDPRAVYRAVLRFLELAEIDIGHYGVVNARQGVRSAVVSKIVNKKIPMPARKAVRLLIPSKTIRSRTRLLLDAVNRRPLAPAGIPEPLRDRLVSELEPEIRALEKLIDRDLSAWTDLTAAGHLN